MTGCGIMSSVRGMLLQGGSTIKVSIERPVATRHRRDMTEKLLKVTLNPNKQQHIIRNFIAVISNVKVPQGSFACHSHHKAYLVMLNRGPEEWILSAPSHDRFFILISHFFIQQLLSLR